MRARCAAPLPLTTRARYTALLPLCLIAACEEPPDGEAGASVAEVSAPNTLTAAEEAAGWSLLFDGVSTDGWRGYGREDFPTGGWQVESGELVGQSTSGDMDGGDIITVAEFTDFELVFDFKVGPEGNSGIFYRVRELEMLLPAPPTPITLMLACPTSNSSLFPCWALCTTKSIVFPLFPARADWSMLAIEERSRGTLL